MKEFQLGEQPHWINTEPARISHNPIFASTLVLQERSFQTLISRGYCVVEVPCLTQQLYNTFHQGFEAFSKSPIEHRLPFATIQFEQDFNSPNQFHGYSEVSSLKSQFMMRNKGRSGIPLPMPEEIADVGSRLYDALDNLCREVAHKVVSLGFGLSPLEVDELLDPVQLPPEYISSSILDSFYYRQDATAETQERFFNNHASHTDSGLLTVVVCTDEPGLEVLDPILGCWVALETCLHAYAQKVGRSHREFAILFWSDSVAYLNLPQLKPCLHRVEKLQSSQTGSKERFSVVFKQRTCPLVTMPRCTFLFIL